jgi:hypothetical protein
LRNESCPVFFYLVGCFVPIKNVPGNWGLPRKPEKVQGVQQNGPW